MLLFKNNKRYSKKCTKNKRVCFSEINDNENESENEK